MGLIPEDVIAQVIDRSDIVEVVSAYVPLKKAGRNFKANCPFHNEKSPSFVVNPDKQIFRCFGCGVGGNVVNFVMKHDHMEFPEAIRLLAEKVNVVIPESANAHSHDHRRLSILKLNKIACDFFYNNLFSDKSSAAQKAREYLKKRKLGLETAKTFQIGFALDQWDGLIKYLRKQDVNLRLIEEAGLIIPRDNREGYYDRFRNRIIFPIFDTRSQCRAFGARTMEVGDKVGAKYINSPETPVYTKGHYVYAFNLSKANISAEDSVIITEGYMDCIVPYQAGVKNIVASLGTALTPEQVRVLKRYTQNVLMLFDSDSAGESAIMRSLDMLAEEGLQVKIVRLPEGHDPDSYICDFGVVSFKEHVENALSLFDFKFNLLASRFDMHEVEGKEKISKSMLETINKFDSAVIQSGYVRKLAQKLDVPEQALLDEMKKADRVLSSRSYQMRPKVQVANKNIRAVEENILKLLFEDESFISSSRNDMDLADIEDERIRDVISKIYEIFDQGKKITVPGVMGCIQDENTLDLISQLVVSEHIGREHNKQLYNDYIDRIKKDRLKQQRHNIMQQIREAEDSGNHSKVEKLLEKFNRSLKGERGRREDEKEVCQKEK